MGPVEGIEVVEEVIPEAVVEEEMTEVLAVLARPYMFNRLGPPQYSV